MRVSYKALGGKLVFDIDSPDIKGLFEEISRLQEIFEESSCGACGKSNIRLRTRTVDNNKYFEIHCQDCRATLALGQNKIGGNLFPKLKDREGNYIPNRGWKVWQKSAGASGGGFDDAEAPF